MTSTGLSTGTRARIQATDLLVRALIDEFGKASALIERLNDRTYTLGCEDKRSIGAHFRHNYDLVNNCIAGLRSGQVDYVRRKRDARIENDRGYVIERFGLLRSTLDGLSSELINARVQVRSEIDAEIWHSSSGSREIEFVLSHTVHHHAMIAENLRGLDIPVPDNFGVAPSTLEYWGEQSNSGDS